MATEVAAAPVEAVPVEDVDDDLPALKEATTEEGAPATAGAEEGSKSRTEKKALKAFDKLGLEEISGVKEVRMKKNKNITFVVSDPVVLKNPGTDTYVVVGEVNVEDSQQELHKMTSQHLQSLASMQGAAAEAAAGGAPASSAAFEDALASSSSAATTDAAASSDAEGAAAGASEGADQDGFAAKDIKLVMDQAGADRDAAIKALKNANGEIVEAIMELTM